MPAALNDPMSVAIEGYMDRDVLQPLYKGIYNSFSPSDASKIMFFEVSPQTPFMKAGFTELPGGQGKETTHVLNDHTYCC